ATEPGRTRAVHYPPDVGRSCRERGRDDRRSNTREQRCPPRRRRSSPACPLLVLLPPDRLLRREWGRTRMRHLRPPPHEGREARGSQRVVWLLQLPAEPLDGRGGIVADAVDREEHVIGPADEAGQKCRAVLDAAVVVQEAGAGAFD